MSVRSVVSEASNHSFSLVENDDAVSDLSDEDISFDRQNGDSIVYMPAPASEDTLGIQTDHTKKDGPTENVCEVEAVDDQSPTDNTPHESPTFAIRRKPVPSQVGSSLTSPPCEKHDTSSIRLANPWTPIWLQRSTLIAFSNLFICFAVALIVLWRVAVSHNGFSIAASRNEYYWKYGPTAVLVIVMGLWSQVDKYTRLLVPWDAALTQGMNDKDALLLDYLSPMPHTIVWTAIKNRQFSVLVTTLGSLLLKAIVTASTALLILTPTSMINKNYQVTLAGSFDPSTFTDSSEYLDITGDDPSTMLYYGNLENGLAQRNGTSNLGAFQQPLLPRISKDLYTMTLPVETFYPSYVCTTTRLTVTDPLASLEDGSYAGQYTLSIDNSPCPNVTINGTSPTAYVEMPGIATFGGTNGWPRSSYTRLDYITIACPTSSDQDTEYSPSTYEEQVDFFIISESLPQSPDQLATNGSISGKIGRCSAITCKADFRVQRAMIRSDQATRNSDRAFNILEGAGEDLPTQGLTSYLLQTTTPRFIFDAANLPGVYYERQSDIDFKTALVSWDTGSDDSADDTSGDLIGPTNSSETTNPIKRQTTDVQAQSTDFHTLFQLFARAANGSDWTSTFDPTILKTGAENAMNGIMSQWAAERLFNNATTTTAAELAYSENRLQIKPLALWFMVAGFLVMSLCSALMVFLRPTSVLPGSPAPLTGFSMILSTHAHLQSMLTSIFSSTDCPTTSGKTTWYRPFTCRKTFIGLMVLIPICIIGVLEGLQHVSDTQHGFAGVNSLSFALESWTHYLPAIVMVLIAVAYGAIDFNISIFNQYSKLKHGARTRETIDKDLTMRIPAHTLFTALLTRQWGAALATAAALFASGLTIAVSGLYSIGSPDLSFQSNFRGLDTLDVLLNNGSTGDNGVATVLSLMDNLNLTFPQWTYEDLVIPEIEYESDALNFTNTQLTITLPVYRPVLRCIYLPPENILVSISAPPFDAYQDGYTKIEANFTAIPVLSETCNTTRLPNSTMKIPRFSLDAQEFEPLDNGTGTFVGYLALELEFFDYTQPGSKRSIPFDDSWTGCPTHAFAIAAFSSSGVNQAAEGLSDDDSETSVLLSSANVKVLQCSQKVEVINADVTFRLPHFDLDLENPVALPEESPSIYLTARDAFDDSTTDSFATHFLPSIDQYYNLLNVPGDFNAEYRGFVRALRFGPDPAEPWPLIQNTDEARSAFYNATNRLYSRYMAQYLHKNSRRSLAAVTEEATATTTQSPIYTGIILSHNNYRVIQHRGPKIALQVLLGLMALCILLACYMVDMREVLTREPCSIIGKGSLVVGSRLLEVASQTSEGDSGFKDGRTKRSPFEGFLLKLSWWEDIGSQRSRDSNVSEQNGEEVAEVDGSSADNGKERWGIDIVQAL